MILGLYTAASGMQVQQLMSDASANNLANASTNGYRRRQMTVESFPRMLDDRLAFPLRDGATASTTVPDWLLPTSTCVTTPGVLRPTGNPTDVAIRGEGLFTIVSPAGVTAYTRDGAFSLNPEQQLITADGWLVQGERGPITIDNPNWEIDRTGQVVVNGVVADRLAVVEITDPAGSSALGDARWLATDVRPVASVQVEQGYLESANVNTVSEMVALITATRSFEANQRCIQIIDATLERAANDVGRLA